MDVNSETNINSFGFFLGQKGGGDANFFIYDVTTSTLTLAPDAVAVNNTTDGKAWAYVDGLSIDLKAGNVYDFGVYGDAPLTVGLDPTSSSFTGGLTLPASGPASYNVTGDVIGSALSGTINADGLFDGGCGAADRTIRQRLRLSRARLSCWARGFWRLLGRCGAGCLGGRVCRKRYFEQDGSQ